MRTALLLRDPRYTIHDQRAMLAQRVISLALGYEDLNDQQTMRTDPALQTVSTAIRRNGSFMAITELLLLALGRLLR
ncbi:MAG: transposase [Pirellulales bacterium]